VQFSCSHLLQTEHFLQPHSFFCYIVVFLTFLTTVTAIIFLGITRVLILNHFLGIILHDFGFLFLPLDDWRTSENRRLLVEGTISREFWLAFLSVKPGWVLMDGRMDAGVKTCHFNGLYST
jgi:hypothetical protein